MDIIEEWEDCPDCADDLHQPGDGSKCRLRKRPIWQVWHNGENISGTLYTLRETIEFVIAWAMKV